MSENEVRDMSERVGYFDTVKKIVYDGKYRD